MKTMNKTSNKTTNKPMEVKTMKTKLKQAIKFLTKEETIIAILCMVESSLITTFIKSCNDAPLHIYITMYLSAMLYCTAQNFYFTYYGAWDKITSRHVIWSAAAIFVTFLYFMGGNSFLSIVIGLYLATCKFILFKGKDGQPLTTAEIKKLLKIA